MNENSHRFSRVCGVFYALRFYVKHWEDMKAENIGYLLWGSGGTGKNYFAGCIANALMEKEISVRMTNFALVLNNLVAAFEDRNEDISIFCRYTRRPAVGYHELTEQRGWPSEMEEAMLRQTSQALVTALYPRLSHEDEPQGESNSMSNQKPILETYARQNGFTNLCWYTDDGYRGANFQRPGFQAMLVGIETRKIGTVIAKDMSRLGRNYLQVGMYTEMLFPQKDVRFIAINDGEDSTQGDKNFTPLRNLFNEWMVRDTSKKIKALKKASGDNRCL